MGKRDRRKLDTATANVIAPPPRAWTFLDRWAIPAATVSVLACAFLMAAFPTVSDDVFMHLAVGRRFFQTGHFADPDPWLFSLPDYHRKWIDIAYWGTHLTVTKLHELGGFALLVALKSLLILSAACAPIWLARRLGYRSVLVPAVLLLALWSASDRFIERGSLISDCFGPWVLALVMAEMARPTRLRWMLPALLLVWTNFHPGVLVGLFFVLCAAALRFQEWRRWLPLVIACVIACVAHPDGARHLLWAVETARGSTGAFRAHNFEMMPTLSPEHADSREVRLFLVLLAVSWLALAYAFVMQSRPWLGLFVVAALTWFGLSTVRFVTTASMSLPVAVVGILAGARRTQDAGRAKRDEPRTEVRKTMVSATAVLALATAGLDAKIAFAGYATTSGERSFGFGLDREAAPFDGADFITSIPLHGGIFNEHSFGSFLTWYWDGKPRIYFHGYVLDEGFYDRDYLGVGRSPIEFDRIVSQYDISAFFLRSMPVSANQGPLVYRLLLTKPEWRLVYWDDRSMVFLKSRPEHEAFLAANEFRYFDPFRPERLDKGLKQDPARVLDETVRHLASVPGDLSARNIIQKVFRKEPDQLLKERAAKELLMNAAPK